MTDDEYQELRRKQDFVADLKGKNPSEAYLRAYPDDHLIAAREYGDLTLGCRATIDRLLDKRFEQRKLPTKIAVAGLGLAGITLLAKLFGV